MEPREQIRNQPGPLRSFLARSLAVLLIALLACAAGSALAVPWSGSASRILPALCLAMSIGSVLAYRAAFHFANHSDFRFVAAPATFGLAAFLASAGTRWPQRLGPLLAAAFLAVSQAFFGLLWISELV